jgi:uncharacterized protein (TIGR01244 family)
MTGDIRKLDDQALVGGQITPGQVRELAAQGVTMLVNNRPDGEEPDQPRASEIEAAAADAGIAYRYVPIRRGIGPSDVDAMQEAMDQCGEGRMLAFCRSGTRSALAVALARRGQGASRDEIERCLGDAGFDCGPIAHLL